MDQTDLIFKNLTIENLPYLTFNSSEIKMNYEELSPTYNMTSLEDVYLEQNLNTSNKYIKNSTLLKLKLREIPTLYYPDFSQNPIVCWTFIFLFLLEFLVGVIGNLFVCITVYRNKSMHSPVNYYIVNLGLCDFLIVAVVLPTKLFELTANANLNMLNNSWCTLIRFFESVIVFVSLFTLVAICLERYYAVVYPMHSRIHRTDYRIRRVLLLVWILPILVASPNIIPALARKHNFFSEYGQFSRLTCFDTFSDEFRRYYFLFLFFFMYFIPLLFIGTTCFCVMRVLFRKLPIQARRESRAISLERGRRKVAKMVLVIVCTFLVCWSPYFLVTLVTQLQSHNFLQSGQFFFTMLSINLLCFTNSCVNPIVYFAMSTRFRKGFICIFRSLRFCSGRSGSSNEVPSANLTMQGNIRTNGYVIERNERMRRGTNAHCLILPNGSSTLIRNECLMNGNRGRNVSSYSSSSSQSQRQVRNSPSYETALASSYAPKTQLEKLMSSTTTETSPHTSTLQSRNQLFSKNTRSHTIIFEFHHFETSNLSERDLKLAPLELLTTFPPTYQETFLL